MTTAMPSATTTEPQVFEQAARRTWKTPLVLGALTVLAWVIFVIFPMSSDSVTRFALAGDGDAIPLPVLAFPVQVTGHLIAVLMVLVVIACAYFVRVFGRTPVWLIGLYSVFAVVGFLTWAAAGATVPVAGLLLGAVSLSVPLIFGALGGVISERVGVINVAIEGQLLGGAFVSAVIASVTGNAYVGLVGAMVAGMVVSFVLAAFAIKYVVDQVIVGVVLNVLVTGLTSFLFSHVLEANPEFLNSPPRFDRFTIPLLGDIPILGPVLFRQTFVVYLMYVAVIAIFFALFYTRWGLRLRAVGEHPGAADTVGISVHSRRFWGVSIAGAIAGLGGAYFTLGSVGAFNKEMTAGVGFIALAAVIFGRWDPLRATAAAVLFGFASSMQNVLGIVGSPAPSEFLLMLPYLVTIFAVAGLVGRIRGPAALGKPYAKQ